MKHLKILLLLICSAIVISCGSYKRYSSEIELQQKIEEWQKKQNDKTILETVETTIDYFDNQDDLKLGIRKDTVTEFKPKKWSYTQKRETKTTDKGKEENQKITDSNLKQDEDFKENSWRPPWYFSGLIVIALLVVFKVFKSYFKIVRI